MRPTDPYRPQLSSDRGMVDRLIKTDKEIMIGFGAEFSTTTVTETGQEIILIIYLHIFIFYLFTNYKKKKKLEK